MLVRLVVPQFGFEAGEVGSAWSWRVSSNGTYEYLRVRFTGDPETYTLYPGSFEIMEES